MCAEYTVFKLWMQLKLVSDTAAINFQSSYNLKSSTKPSLLQRRLYVRRRGLRFDPGGTPDVAMYLPIHVHYKLHRELHLIGKT